jgi:hypothetical protein
MQFSCHRLFTGKRSVFCLSQELKPANERTEEEDLDLLPICETDGIISPVLDTPVPHFSPYLAPGFPNRTTSLRL